MVAVACFFPGRAKDLPAPPRIFVPVYAMVFRVIVPLILNHDTRLRLMISVRPRPFYPGFRN